MNIYLVISEELKEAVYEDWFNNVGHWEHYRIAELVAARNHSQARWLAWKADKASFTGCMADMPRMTCRLRVKDIDIEPGVVSDNQEFVPHWGQEDEGISLP